MMSFSHKVIIENNYNFFKLTINDKSFELVEPLVERFSRILNRIEKRLNNIDSHAFDFEIMFATRILPENIVNRYQLLSCFTEIMRVFVGNKGPDDYMDCETNYISLITDDYRQHFYFHFHSTVDKYNLFEYQRHWIPQIFIA
jgi:hypothetical protein